jgi:hypothetical protein
MLAYKDITTWGGTNESKIEPIKYEPINYERCSVNGLDRCTQYAHLSEIDPLCKIAKLDMAAAPLGGKKGHVARYGNHRSDLNLQKFL